MARLLVTAMIIDRTIEEYPHRGTFYRYACSEDTPLLEREDSEEKVLETSCDIQEASKNDSGNVIKASFNVYFPFDKESGISIERGMLFKGSAYGLEVNGIVIGVFPTQLGGCVCYIKDMDV